MSPVLKQIINKRKEENPLSCCDSVEHSFKEKLSLQSRRQDKEEKELEVFEMLEGATLNSSFSRSGHIRYIWAGLMGLLRAHFGIWASPLKWAFL